FCVVCARDLRGLLSFPTRRSSDLHHTALRLGFSYGGPTEIGGLVVAPAYRKAVEKLGLLISYVRFLFISAHRNWFRNEVLAELLDRKSTRLNSSHVKISYAVFCLK